MVRKVLHTISVISLVSVMSIAPTSTWALGGSDADPANQIGEKTQKCQAAISKLSRKFAVQIVKGVSRCFDEVIKCDDKADASAHDDCVGKLLIEDRGRCALGKLSNALPYLGTNSGAAASELHRSTIGRAHFKFVEKLAASCLGSEVDLSTAGTGLGFDPAPVSRGPLADAVNSNVDGRGVACSAHKLVSDAYPRLDEIVDILITHPDAAGVAIAIIILDDETPSFSECR